jgi:hypothetical protein
MSHHNSRHEPHSHDRHDAGDELSPKEKLLKLLEHWMKHNEGHAQTYRQWAETAGAQSMPEVALRLQEAAEVTVAVNRQFEAALKCLRKTEGEK